jgi:hypothetical protein
MTDDARPPPSTLKGRLADVYVPALVAGELEGLSRRLGSRATVDDPLHGRASGLAALEALIAKASAVFVEGGGVYRHVYSTTGVDRDAAEGVVTMTHGGEKRDVPIAVVAERRKLREIELRLYYARAPGTPPDPRGPLVPPGYGPTLPAVMAGVVDAFRKRDVESAIAAFEESAELVDPHGRRLAKTTGAMGTFLADLGPMDVSIAGCADDGRTCAVEVSMAMGGHEPMPGLFSFQRGDSGLVRELRLYWD